MSGLGEAGAHKRDPESRSWEWGRGVMDEPRETALETGGCKGVAAGRLQKISGTENISRKGPEFSRLCKREGWLQALGGRARTPRSEARRAVSTADRAPALGGIITGGVGGGPGAVPEASEHRGDLRGGHTASPPGSLTSTHGAVLSFHTGVLGRGSGLRASQVPEAA